MPVAYSYVRFSSPRQQHGASLKRQLEAAAAYAHQHGLVLNESSFKDLGVSAFKSKNAEAQLGAFIEAVKTKKIASGSYLLVESIDRLSRDDVEAALELFISITRLGIVIVTLADGTVYSSATIKKNWTQLIIALGVMARANEESATKSMRIRDAYKRREDSGLFVMPRAPFWLKLSKDRKHMTIIPEKAKWIKHIFEWSIEGHGYGEIAARLNKAKVPIVRDGVFWRHTNVRSVLTNPAAYGTYRTKYGLKEDYIPAVVTKSQWLQAQQALAARGAKHHKGSYRKDNPDNILAGIARCAYCGSTMRLRKWRYQWKNVVDNPTRYWSLRCSKQDLGAACDHKDRYQFEAVEQALVFHLTSQLKGLTTSVFAAKNAQRLELEAGIAAATDDQRKLTKLYLATEAEEIAGQIKELEAKIASLKDQLRVAGPAGLEGDAEDNVQLLVKFLALHKKNDHKELTKLRMKIRPWLVNHINAIEFMSGAEDKFDPVIGVEYKNGEKAVVSLADWWREPYQGQ